VCTSARLQAIDKEVSSGDEQGHGPDVGSNEWKSVIEFRLNLRNEPGVPDPSTDAWCDYIEGKLQERDREKLEHIDNETIRPSFDCAGAEAGSAELLVCNNPQLASLDIQLAEVYSKATALAVDERPHMLTAEQRGWLKGRDECWKSPDQTSCIAKAYRHRIAELQARYQLADSIGPIAYACDENPASEMVVTFFATEPKTLVAERGDSVSVMFIERSANGSLYVGRNKSFWEFQRGYAQVIWGYEAEEMICVSSN